jgi:hypothetical protein
LNASKINGRHPIGSIDDGNDIGLDTVNSAAHLDSAISKLEEVTRLHRNAKADKKDLMTKFDLIRHLCVLRFLQKIKQVSRSKKDPIIKLVALRYGAMSL